MIDRTLGVEVRQVNQESKMLYVAVHAIKEVYMYRSNYTKNVAIPLADHD